MTLNDGREGCIGGFGWRKEKRNAVIILQFKNKTNNNKIVLK